MDLADVRNSTSVVCGRRDGILRRMSTRMPSFLSANFVARLMCRSDRSPASVYDVTVSIFMSVAWSPIRFLRTCVCFVVFITVEWKRAVRHTFRDCFMMSIQVWMSARKRLCLLRNCISFCMRIPNRNVYAVRKLLPPWCSSFAECHSLI